MVVAIDGGESSTFLHKYDRNGCGFIRFRVFVFDREEEIEK